MGDAFMFVRTRSQDGDHHKPYQFVAVIATGQKPPLRVRIKRTTCIVGL